MTKKGLLAGLILFSSFAHADFSGNIAIEALAFSEGGQFSQQFDNNATLSLKPKWDGEWNEGDDLWSVEVFARADDKDDGRNHADIRELLWLHLDGDNEWRVGINTMFWGVTESQHLVDVINQIDQVEGIDGEEKLGQPMLHLKRYEDWGVLDFLILPGFRERTFHSTEARLRPALVVDGDQASYQSTDEEQHIDYAIRFSQSYGDLDLGVSWFDGTRRDPIYLLGSDSNGDPVLTPYYEQMQQLGIDAQLIHQEWIWRLELVHREADSSNMDAFTAGFEYSFYGIFDSDTDFGALVEFSHDNRAEGLRGVFDRDLFFGGRFGFNDVQSTEILVGMVTDIENQSRTFRLEGNRRFGDSWKGTIEAQIFSNIDQADPLFALKDDDYLLIEMAYYF